MKRLAARVARLEVQLLPPPPFVPSGQLLETINRMIDAARKWAGTEHLTAESLNAYFDSWYDRDEGPAGTH